jgi:MFS transporter, DHA3 family, macrolide efflux protein
MTDLSSSGEPSRGGEHPAAGGDAPRSGRIGGGRVFLLVWFGQMASMFGTNLTGFALGVWAYQKTGSATQFAVVNSVAVLPSILVSPLAGALVDRWDRRRAMLLSDVGAGLGSLSIMWMVLTDHLHIWSVVIAVALSSVMGSLRQPAYSAATTLLVPPEQLGRTAGMVQFSSGVAQILAPAAAGFLMLSIGLMGILWIDLTSFAVALLTLLIVRFPGAKPTPSKDGKPSLRKDASFGLSYIRANQGLRALLTFAMASAFCLSIVEVLLTPLILGFGSAATLGTVFSVGGVGMLLGSLTMIAWGGPRRLVYGVLGFGLLQGATVVVVGLRPSAVLVGIGIFSALFVTQIIMGCNETLWQRSVPPELQGRVFATRNMLVQASLPLAFLVAGPLADQIFEPWLAVAGPLSSTLGGVFGTGPGRGIGLLYVMQGIAVTLVAAVGFSYAPLRHMTPPHVPQPITKEPSSENGD